MPVIGIDLGNENFKIATIRFGRVQILTNETGDRMTPSYMSFAEKTRCFGFPAKYNLMTNWPNTIYGFKQQFEMRYSAEFTHLEKPYMLYPLFKDQDGDYTGVQVSYLNHYMFLTIQQVMAMFLVKIKELAENELNDEVTGCVLSVPSYFGNKARLALLDAASIANLKVLGLLNEPTAAALFYTYQKLQQLPQNSIKAVFLDMGLTSLQISACILSNTGINVLYTTCVTGVGGRDFDNSITSHFISKFKTDYNLIVKPNSQAIIRLRSECEKVKRQLSACTSSVPFTMDNFMGKDVSGDLDRQKMENVCKSLLKKIENGMRDFLREVEWETSNIGFVELVGGSAQIPAVKHLVKRVFKCEAKMTFNMDEAVVSGCALQAAMLSPNLRATMSHPLRIRDVQMYPIKVVSDSDKGIREFVAFPENHQIPHSVIMRWCSHPGQCTLRAYYGKPNERLKPESFIGHYSINDIPILSFNEFISIKLRMNVYGIFSVSARLDVLEDTKEEIDQSKEIMIDISNARIRNTEVRDNHQPKRLKMFDPILTVKADVPRLSIDQIVKFSHKQTELTQSEMNENRRPEYSTNRPSLREELDQYGSGEKTMQVWTQIFDTLKSIDNFRAATSKVQAIINAQGKMHSCLPSVCFSKIESAWHAVSARECWLNDLGMKILQILPASPDEVNKEKSDFVRNMTELLNDAEDYLQASESAHERMHMH